MRTLFSCSLNWKLGTGHGVYGTPSMADVSSVPDQHSLRPGEQHTLACCTKCMTPVGHMVTYIIMPTNACVVLILGKVKISW